MTLYHKLEEISLKFPRKNCLFFQKENLSYRGLKEKVENLSAGFYNSLGIRKEDKVAILLHNSIDYVVSLFALFRLGAVAVPLNVFLKAQELNYIISDCNPSYIITSSEFLNELEPLMLEIKSKIILVDEPRGNFLYWGDLFERRAFCLEREVTEDATAVICYTSSTSGKPKGVMLSHRNFISDVEGSLKATSMSRKDRFLIFLPMFHSYTLTVCIFIPLLIGASIYIFSSRHINSMARFIFFKRITILVGIPRIFRMFAKITIPRIFLIFCPVRFAISGADALAPEIITAFKDKFNITLVQGYGLTEASPVVCLNPLKRQKMGAVGLPLPNCELKVVDEEENELPINTPGELIVKGPMVMKGYYQMPQETKEAIKGGWLFTGDIAKIDEDGYVYIVDRKKDMIITHGMNIYSKEVEDAIAEHPSVEEVAVVGRKDEIRGEVPVAIVVLKEGENVAAGELVDFMKEEIADYKIPHSIEFRKELPKTPTGKVLKRILRDEINVKSVV